MTNERNETVQNHNELKSRFGQLFTEVEKILFSHDPIGIAFYGDDNIPDTPAKSATEVDTILPRLRTANTASDVTDIVYEEFIRWFGGVETIGPKARYRALSDEIWVAWNQFKEHSK